MKIIYGRAQSVKTTELVVADNNLKRHVTNMAYKMHRLSDFEIIGNIPRKS